MVNEKEARCFAGGGTNSSCALTGCQSKHRKMMNPAIMLAIELLLRRTLRLLDK